MTINKNNRGDADVLAVASDLASVEADITQLQSDVANVANAASDFVSLTDTPAAYTDQAGKLVVVNTDEDGLEFVSSNTTGSYTMQLDFELSGNTTSNTYVDFANASNQIFTTTVSGPHVISLNITRLYSTGSSAYLDWSFCIDDVDYDAGYTAITAEGIGDCATIQQVINIEAGEHTIRPRWKRTLGSGTAVIDYAPSNLAPLIIQANKGFVSGAADFLGLADAPSAYTGEAGKLVAVNADEDGVEFVGEWTAYTPTGSWVANTTYTGLYRKVGDTMSLQFKLAVSGAPTNVPLTVNLPEGFIVDESKLLRDSSNVAPLGLVTLLDSGTTRAIGYIYYEGDTGKLTIRSLTATGSILVTTALSATSPWTWANGDHLIAEAAAVPVVAV